ncbi:sulfatase-like hydrolase/transferase [Haloarculaceae archaeon H-GB11]|nr:sulfatase-like hydrolase/transferase [Haloarculaceae archaeon H-GB11]
MSRPPNIVWITLDSLRYDRTTMSGYRRDTTPNLARLASGGRSFSECTAHSNFTLVSAPSILTGTYPSHHGVGMGINDRLPESVPTVAELLSAAGYHTGCISEIARVSDATGLDRGFDTFEFTFNRSGTDHLAEKGRAMGSHLMENVLPNISNFVYDSRGLTNGFGLKYTTEMARSYVRAREGSRSSYISMPSVPTTRIGRPPRFSGVTPTTFQ